MKEGNLLKIKLSFCAAIVCLIIFAILYSLSLNSYTKVSFFDVGQGDSILLQTAAGQNILIDGGGGEEVLFELSQSLSWWDRTIDLIILTHPHDDHVAGLNLVLDNYNVKKILYTGVTHNSPAYLAWLEKIEQKNISTVIADHSQTIQLDDECKINILYPFESFFHKEVENINNTSIVSELQCEESSILLMGDAEIELEQALIDNGAELRADVLKLGHHGSITSSSEKFLEIVKPRIGIISVGIDNRFKHPSRRIENRLKHLNIEYFRTDLDETVVFTNENGIFVKE